MSEDETAAITLLRLSTAGAIHQITTQHRESGGVHIDILRRSASNMRVLDERTARAFDDVASAFEWYTEELERIAARLLAPEEKA